METDVTGLDAELPQAGPGVLRQIQWPLGWREMGVRARRVPASVWVPLGVGLLGLGIGCYQLSLANVLFGVHGYTGNGYDDGVYLGTATRLVHGVVPYKDFDFLHPPGIALLMSPVALLGRLIGTRDALALARCLTVCVVGANAALAALAVRHRRAPTMVVAGASMATFPLAVAADHSLMLEPYLVLFCLLGTVLLFRDGELAKPRGVLLSGVAFGFAGAVKVWAVLPIAAAAAVCLLTRRRAVRSYLVGVVLGFGVPSLPFFLLAPRAFWHDVVTAQLGRGTSGVGGLSIAERLVMITGLGGLPSLGAGTGMAVVLGVVLAMVIAAVYLTSWRRLSPMEWFAVIAVASVMPGMFLSPEYYDHYAYFPAAFLALVLAVCAGRILDAGRDLLSRFGTGTRRTVSVWAPALTSIAFLIVVALVVEQGTSYAADYLAPSADPAAPVSTSIPEGSCVVFDYGILSLDADRYDPAANGCPAIVDAFGMWITRDNGNPPPASPPFPTEFVASWRAWLERADYVVLSVPGSNYIPWTPDLLSWFNANYLLVSTQPRTYVYNHFSRVPTGPARSLLEAGIIAGQAGRLDEATADFEQVIRIDPADSFAYFDLGVAWTHHQLQPAAAYYRRAIFLNPRFAAAMFNLAVLETPSDPIGAIDLYRRILTIKPHAPNTELNLGILLIRSGDAVEGHALVASAVAQNPGLAAQLPPDISVSAGRK